MKCRLNEAQTGIKIAGRNINNLRYADNTTLMEESEEELNSLLMKVKEESEKVGLKFNIHISTCILHRYTWDKIKLKKKSKQTNKKTQHSEN